MTLDQLDIYIGLLVQRSMLPEYDEGHLPASYVSRQIEWAEVQAEAIERGGLVLTNNERSEVRSETRHL